MKIEQLVPKKGRTEIQATLDGMVNLVHDELTLKLDPEGARTAATMLTAAALRADQIRTLHKQMPGGLDEQGQIAWLQSQFEGKDK